MTTIQAGAEPRTALPGGRGVRRSELTISILSADNDCGAAYLRFCALNMLPEFNIGYANVVKT
jgi:hypothetical protein